MTEYPQLANAAYVFVSILNSPRAKCRKRIDLHARIRSEKITDLNYDRGLSQEIVLKWVGEHDGDRDQYSSLRPDVTVVHVAELGTMDVRRRNALAVGNVDDGLELGSEQSDRRSRPADERLRVLC